MFLQPLLMIIAGNLFFNTELIEANTRQPIITTPLGRIVGSTLTTVLGKPIYAFRGIRYATAERFQPPVSFKDWPEEYNATVDAPACPQPVIRPVAEDCLFLNVYSTKLPEEGKNSKRPVYVLIHAGGFYSVTGSSIWTGSHYFMDQDIVLVTFNYRLGSLGFLSTGDKLAPGNNGLKDQVAVLKWVKDNIAAFGGDPDLVTISGYSAGATSVSSHLVSPMSQGLFHRAIIMSGSAYNIWRIPNHQFGLAQKQADLVGCPRDTSADIVKCLITKSAEELGDSLIGFFEFINNPLLLWRPVIEPDFGQERFLSEDPVALVQQGKFAKVPIMAGLTELEFYYEAYQIVENSTILQEFDQNFDKLAPIVFAYDAEPSRNVSGDLRSFYLGDGPLTENSLNGLGELYADAVSGYGVNRAVRLLSAKTNHPVYYYLFRYNGRYSHYYLTNTTTPIGAVHHDDLIYLYYIPPLFPKFNTTFPEYEMVRKLSKIHANFALTGNPISVPTNEFDNVNWQPFTNENNKYLDIGNKLVMKKNLFKDRYDLWNKLFPLASS